MIVLRIIGGLGNQLFIYAFGRALQKKYNMDVYFDTYSGYKNDPFKRKYELDNFDTKIKKTGLLDSIYFPVRKRSKVIANILFAGSLYIEGDQNLSIDRLVSQEKQFKKIFLQGYFQKSKYSEVVEKEIRQEITLKKSLSKVANDYLSEINKNNSVALHIRGKERKEISSVQFYIESIKNIKQKINRPIIFVFTDDIEWSKKILSEQQNIFFIENTSNHLEDFWLMRNCKHFIIPDSTFSWWASSLGAKSHSIILKPLNNTYDART